MRTNRSLALLAPLLALLLSLAVPTPALAVHSTSAAAQQSFEDIFTQAGKILIPMRFGGTGLTSAGVAGNVLTSTGTAWTSSPPAPAVPHAVLSAQHSDTLAAVVVRGDLIVGNATPLWSRLARCAANDYIGSDGTDTLCRTILSTHITNSTFVTSVTGTAPIISSGGLTPAISLSDTAVTPGSYTYSSITVDAKGRLTAASSGTAAVTAVTATAPITSTGGLTPVIACATCVTSVTGTAPITSSGGTTPAISLDDTAVTPGSYTYSSITVDAKGRLTAASSGAAPAPNDAQYWVATANGTLTAERDLGLLTTGLVLNTVTAAVGVPSTYVGASCTNQFPRSLDASGAATCASVSLTADVSGVLPAANGGTAIANGASATLTLPNAATTISGGGTLALGGFTLTVPATGSAALLATANVFTALQTVTVASSPVALLERTSAITNTRATVASLKHTTSGASINGFGLSLDFIVRDSSATDNTIAQISAERFAGDNNGLLIFSTANSGVMNDRAYFDSGGNFNPYTDNLYTTGLAAGPAWLGVYATNTIQVGRASAFTGSLKLGHASSAFLTTIQAGNATSAETYILPVTDGVANQFLQTNGSGVLTFAHSGYILHAGFGATNPADASTYYWGPLPQLSATTTAGDRKFYIPRSGTVKAAYVTMNQTVGTNEASTLSFRLNDTTDTTISSAIDNSVAAFFVNNTSLNIAVTAGDFFEIKWVTPTWVTNPTNIRNAVVLWIE